MAGVMEGREGGLGRAAAALALLLAVALLIATQAWAIPMMLWDHLDLVPMYEAWQAGTLVGSGVASIHDGSHLHLPAYLLLLATTWLSGGGPWLDCLLSAALLGAYAMVMLRASARMLPGAAPRVLRLGVVGLVLYPGHLANLQWGWQVAVFLCLAGVAVALVALAREDTGWRGNLLALGATAVASTSFSTGLALVPVALLLVATRQGEGGRRRMALAVPWLLMAGLVATAASRGAAGTQAAGLHAGDAMLYVLNYLGGGISRFATGAAPWLAAAALASAAACAWRLRGDPRMRFWAGLACFALGAAVLTALGRVAHFGPDHAFVARYVSFSSVFWVGWLGVIALARPEWAPRGRRWLDALLAVVLVAAAFNALHLAKNAREVALRAGETAETIRSQYPDVDESVLGEIYFGRTAEARQRLEVLHRNGFAPFRPER